MPLHPKVAEILATLPPPPAELDPVAMRGFEESQVAPLEERLPIDSVEDTSYAGVPVRVYTPADASDDVLVYLHGGAFFLGSLNTHDHIARSLADATGRQVVSVGYRLAPEHPFPAGLDDCFAVVKHLLDAGRTVAVAGDSSGGTYAAAVAGLVTDAGLPGLSHQVLYYPSLDLRFAESIESGRYPSLKENAEGNGLTTAGLLPFNSFYLRSADPTDPRVSPILREDLSGLPRTLIVTAEMDPLRDEGELYGEKLKAAGVDVTVTRVAGAAHGFVQHFSWLPEFGAVFGETAAFLKGA
ncbi:alpha/beta hydrolase [Nocardioides sp. DS6]|uniref:Alpha/beta hydrolase n=1 Tax=Nocardioides eburneus TaxID=3231482 RepID=A0ABV3ST70_9ACTN